MPKISELPHGVALTGAERFPNDQAGITVSSTINDISAFIIAAGAIGAIAITQAPVGVHHDNPFFFHNYIRLDPYNATSDFNPVGFGVDVNVNGPQAATGTSYAMFAILGNITINNQKANTGSAWCGVAGTVTALVSQVNPLGGGIFGVNGNCHINAGVTGFSQITAGEFDVGVGVGATIENKYGCVVVANGADAVQGTLHDAAYNLYSVPGPTPGWRWGYCVDSFATGKNPMSPSVGACFGARGAISCAYGLQLSEVTCSLAEIFTQHFFIDRFGNTSINIPAGTGITPLTVSKDGTVPQPAPSNAVAQFIGPRIYLDVYGDTATFHARSAAGTSAAPAAIPANAVIGQMILAGWDGSTFNAGVRFKATASGAWSNVSHPTNAQIDTCPAGSVSPATVATFFGSGGVNLGLGLIADPGAGNLRVSGMLTAAAAGITPQAPPAGYLAHFASSTANAAILCDAYALFVPMVTLRSAGGTPAAPTKVLNTQVIGQIIIQGYDSSIYNTGARGIKVAATQDWTPTAHGCNMSFDICPNNSTTPATALLIHPSGGVAIGTISDPGGGVLVTQVGVITSQIIVGTGGAPGAGCIRADNNIFASAFIGNYHASNPLTVGALAAASAVPGWTAYVTDGGAGLANGATVTGGGSTKYLVWSNGVNWTVVGK